MTRLYSSISVETTLSATITSTQTTMAVAADTASALLGGVSLGSLGTNQFTVAIDPDTNNEEIVFITANSGDTFTIVRGQAGSTEIVHSAGALVRHVLTSDDLDYFNTAIQPATLTAKGDTYAASAAGVVGRLAVGSNGQVLTADSTASKGVKWADITPATPRIGQVVQATTTTSTTTASTTYVDATNMTATITPTSSTSKVLVTMNFDVNFDGAPSGVESTYYQIVRGSTAVYEPGYQLAYSSGISSLSWSNRITLVYLDSPGTTSATTYKLQFKKGAQTSSTINYPSGAASVILQEVLV